MYECRVEFSCSPCLRNRYARIFEFLGLSQVVSYFLKQYDCSDGQDGKANPHLVFLLGFNEHELKMIQDCQHEGNFPLKINIISPSDCMTNKRIDLYLKGNKYFPDI
jgi:hypothetical protein